jgi:hypothetical protein
MALSLLLNLIVTPAAALIPVAIGLIILLVALRKGL